MANLYDTCVIVKPERIKNQVISTQLTDNQQFKNIYLFKNRVPNPDFKKGLKYSTLRSCLLHNKSDKTEWEIRHLPKYYTTLKKTTYDLNTGEITAQDDYLTDDLTAGNSRKIKAVNSWTDTFNPLYRNRNISLLFYTLTTANQSKLTIQEMTNVLKKRIQRNGLTFYGYLWVLEISDTGHIHYHLLLATSRINIKGMAMPKFLKVNDVWGARTQIRFVEKNVRYYLSKYFYKNKSRVTGKRLFSKTISKQFYKDFPNNSETTASDNTLQETGSIENNTTISNKNIDTTSEATIFGIKKLIDIWQTNTIHSADYISIRYCVNDNLNRKCKGG